MQTFDQSIFSLFQNELVSYDEALRWASNVDEFKLRVQGISTTSDISRDQMAGTIFSTPGKPNGGVAPPRAGANHRPRLRRSRGSGNRFAPPLTNAALGLAGP